jgi:diguanylate cyclase (GGDEF)-like protein
MAQSASDRVRLPLRGPAATSVSLVLLSTLATALVMGALAARSSYEQLRDRIDERVPVVLEWSGERLHQRIEQVRAEIGRIAQLDAMRVWGESAAAAAPADGARDSRLEGILSQVLVPSQTFSGLIVLDPEGSTRAALGSGPALDGLVQALAPKNAVDAELLDVMQTAQLRRDLAVVGAQSLRVVYPEGAGPHLLASTSLRGPGGRPLGSLHGLVQRDELAAQLRSDLLGGGNLFVVEAEGKVVAAAGDDAAAHPDAFAPEVLGVESVPELRSLWSSARAPVLTSTLPLGRLGWTLVAQQTAAQAFQPLVLPLVRMVAWGAAAIALFTLLASWLGRGMTRPLQALFDAIRGLAKGEFDVELSDAKVHGQYEAIFRAFNSATRRLRELRSRDEVGLRALQEQNQGFQKQHDVLSRLSVTDGLTELHNQRYLKDQLQREIKRLARTREQLSMLIIDIDDFKQLNDRFGHAAGDEFLKQLARILKESVRDTDVLVRYGGEEFVVVACGTDLAGAVTLAEKLCTQVAETSFIVDASMRPRRVTVSIGVAQYRHSRTEFFTAADAALYRAKRAGKNCVVAADPSEAEA